MVNNTFKKLLPYIYCFQVFAMYQLETVLFWVIPRRLVLGSRHFETPYRFHLHRQVDEFRNVGYQEPDAGESPKKGQFPTLYLYEKT